MKTRKGEPVIVVPEEQQQIVELERQLAEANTRIETLTRRLEAAEERAEAWEEAALRKAGKAEYDWMEKNRRYNIERAEQAEAERDQLRRQLALEDGMSPAQKPIELRQRITMYAQQIGRMKDQLDRALTKHDELQRKLDACQCETRVLNESLLIEAKQERDQFRRQLEEIIAASGQTVELGANYRTVIAGINRMRLAVEQVQSDMCNVEQERDQFAAEAERLREALDNSDRIVELTWGVRSKVATPHAAKAAERVKTMENVVNEARTICNLMEALTREGNELAEVDFAAFAELCTAIDALDKPEVQERET